MKGLSADNLPNFHVSAENEVSFEEREESHMHNIVVISANVSGEERRDLLVGDVWEIHDGSLTVYDGVGHVVASYAPGRWVNVMRT